MSLRALLASRGRLVFAAAVLLAAYFAYDAALGAIRTYRLEQQRSAAEAELARLEARRDYLRGVLDYVLSDAYVEQVARRELGYVRDGEVPFLVVGPTPEPGRPGPWWEEQAPPR
jgi:cell division protein FtsB